MTSNHHASYVLGYKRATMGRNKEKRIREEEQTPKNYSQFRLKVETHLHEDEVASNPESERRGECVPGSCTHRLSRHGSWEDPKSVS